MNQTRYSRPFQYQAIPVKGVFKQRCSRYTTNRNMDHPLTLHTVFLKSLKLWSMLFKRYVPLYFLPPPKIQKGTDMTKEKNWILVTNLISSKSKFVNTNEKYQDWSVKLRNIYCFMFRKAVPLFVRVLRNSLTGILFIFLRLIIIVIVINTTNIRRLIVVVVVVTNIRASIILSIITAAEIGALKPHFATLTSNSKTSVLSSGNEFI